MLQLPHVWVLPHPPLPTSLGKMCHHLCITQASLSQPGLPCLGGHTAKRRAQTPQWSWWKGEVRGQQARAAREKPLLRVLGEDMCVHPCMGIVLCLAVKAESGKE